MNLCKLYGKLIRFDLHALQAVPLSPSLSLSLSVQAGVIDGLAKVVNSISEAEHWRSGLKFGLIRARVVQ